MRFSETPRCRTRKDGKRSESGTRRRSDWDCGSDCVAGVVDVLDGRAEPGTHGRGEVDTVLLGVNVPPTEDRGRVGDRRGKGDGRELTCDVGVGRDCGYGD